MSRLYLLLNFRVEYFKIQHTFKKNLLTRLFKCKTLNSCNKTMDNHDFTESI